MNARYIFGSILFTPLLPLMYYQGKKIRASVPQLPEARGPSGFVNYSDHSSDLKLITIGESTIAGIGVESHEEGFSGTLAKELATKLQSNISWKVYARSGYTALMIRNKMIPKIKEDYADIVVVGLGGNDAFTLNSPKKWRRQIISLIQELKMKFPEAAIFFCNMPPIKEFPAFTPLIKRSIGSLVEILGQELDDLVKDYDNLFYFSEIITIKGWCKRFDISEDAEFFSDGVHPSKLTYQTWAREVASEISQNPKFKRL